MDASPIPTNNRRVLVIDDEQQIRDDYLKVLSSAMNDGSEDELNLMSAALFGNETRSLTRGIEFHIDTARQGQEGVSLIVEAITSGQPYALAFVDMRMPPGWDGLETIEHIWEVDEEIQVVICTAYSDHPLEELHRRLGQTDRLLVLKKPFDNVEVRQLAFALTEKWNLARQARATIGDLHRMVEHRTRGLATAIVKLRKATTAQQQAEAEKEALQEQFKQIIPPDYGTETILLVDDEALTGEMTRHILEKIGYSIVPVISQTHACAAYAEQSSEIDLVLIDSSVPELNTLNLVEYVRAGNPAARILVLGDHHTEQDLESIVGSVGYLRKPFTPTELARALRESLD